MPVAMLVLSNLVSCEKPTTQSRHRWYGSRRRRSCSPGWEGGWVEAARQAASGAKEAAKHQHIAIGDNALTHKHLDMLRTHTRHGINTNLATNCGDMMERVRAAIPGKGKLKDAGNWKAGDSKTEVKKGGDEEALAKLADRDRP
jgi:hypothetical protein